MAITLSSAELRTALRLGDSDEETSQTDRLLGYATAAITHYVEDAPDTVHNEAAIRLAGYLFDQPFATRGRADYSNAFRFSGAAAILAPYRKMQLGLPADAQLPATEIIGTGVDEVNALIAAALQPLEMRITANADAIAKLTEDVNS